MSRLSRSWLVVVCAAACGSSTSTGATDTTTSEGIPLEAPVCGKWPASADTHDAGTGGCTPLQRAGRCIGTTPCINECTADEYALYCTDAGEARQMTAQLGCRGAGGHWPVYPAPLCCPCEK